MLHRPLEALGDVFDRCRGTLPILVVVSIEYLNTHEAYSRIWCAVATSDTRDADAVVIACGDGTSYVSTVEARGDIGGVSYKIVAIGAWLLWIVPQAALEVFVIPIDTRVNDRDDHLLFSSLYLPRFE